MIIDSHCHLHDPAFADIRETLTRALAHDVWGMIAVGCDPPTNELTLAAAGQHGKAIWACLGYHPEWAQLDAAALEQVEAQVAAYHSRIVALGEVGLPWYRLEGAADAADVMALGIERLGRLLDLAHRYDLPVVLHAPHGAAAQALPLLTRKGIERAVFHWHKAPADVTRAIVEAGYYVSVSPEVVYRERDRELVQWVPLESLLVETDAPWPFKGEFEGLPSGPWLASRVAEEVAKIKQLPVDEVMYRLSTNTCRLFDLVWT
ncbi:MAG: TatD family hydrolase [Candidatus Rokubacteria bacterium]|nr:TatD family hydrolase [Candidatus Rokubacteria bacterium]